jgi:signal transduction histidine kinase
LNIEVSALLGLTAVVGVLAGAMTFAILRFGAAARDTTRRLRGNTGETAMLSAALEEAVVKLKAQQRAMTLRAEASERLSEEIIASLSAGLLVVSLDGKVQIVNPAGSRLLGLTGDRHRGADYRDLLAHAAPVAALIQQCLTSGRAFSRRSIEMAAGPSGALHLGASVSPLFAPREPQGARTPSKGGESPEVQGAICLFTDLTAVIALEEQLRLKDSLARVGELTAGIAHEFRNGLATIHGYSRLLDLDALPPAFKPYVEGIRAETEAMREVVTNFLNFARPTQLTLSPVDLRAVAERAAEDLRSDAHAMKGEITVAGEFPTVEGDDVLLRQALSNLLRNAVEACTGAGAPPLIRVESKIDRAAGVCTLSVLDNGPGFPDNTRERVFHPFFTTKSQGTGLGLALVQKIVVTHNGRVSVGNRPEGGGSVRVVLPLTTTDAAQVKPAPFAPEALRRASP